MKRIIDVINELDEEELILAYLFAHPPKLFSTTFNKSLSISICFLLLLLFSIYSSTSLVDYYKQISIRRADGTKKVIEKSYFSRGNKIIVTGIKKDETNFLAKKYTKTPYPLVEKITYIREDGTIETTSKRMEAE